MNSTKNASSNSIFVKGLAGTSKYKEDNGTPNAPQSYLTRDGFALGRWQSNVRRIRRAGKLPVERVEKLDRLGFSWAPRRDAFQRGIFETLKYEEKFGDPNAPQTYGTDGGYQLGIWQTHQRRAYREQRLSAERIERLEAMGFKWHVAKGPSRSKHSVLSRQERDQLDKE
jgi:hypothetical protein